MGQVAAVQQFMVTQDLAGSPDAAMWWFSSNTRMRVAICSAMARSCVAVTRVLPACRWFRMNSTSQPWLRGSRPAVGSSNSQTSGERLRTEANATRFFSPLESWCGGRSLNFSILQSRQGRSDALLHLLLAYPKLQRGESDLVPHRRHEQLYVAILEHQADPSAKIEVEGILQECRLGQWFPEGVARNPDRENTAHPGSSAACSSRSHSNPG
jgi:hypothetical protein